jgi:hypothetical protein
VKLREGKGRGRCSCAHRHVLEVAEGPVDLDGQQWWPIATVGGSTEQRREEEVGHEGSVGKPVAWWWRMAGYL